MLGSNPEGNHIYPNLEMITNVNFWDVILVVVQKTKFWMNHFQNQQSVTKDPQKLEHSEQYYQGRSTD